jgi:hypothetical protein
MKRLSLITSLVSLLILSSLSFRAYADNSKVAKGAAGPEDAAAEAAPGDAETAEPADAPEEKPDDQAAADELPAQETAPKAAAPAANNSPDSSSMSAAATAANASMDAEDEILFERIKGFVKRLDAADRKGIEFPVKSIDTAIRAEFLRRTEGNMSFSWVGKHHMRSADTAMARGNLALLIEYGEHLLSLCKKGKVPKDKQLMDLKMMAAKAVIDNANSHLNTSREPASATGEKGTLSAVGKAEMMRREKLLAHMVAGNDYKAIAVKNIDEYGRHYKDAMISSTKEYDKLAAAINMGAESKKGAKAAPKKRKR